MAFMDGKDGSKGFVKRVASSFSMRKKKNATRGPEPKFLPRSKSTGSTNYESMKEKKTTRIKSSAREKIDDRGGLMNKKFGKWRSFDDNDSIWLSSDCASPTYLLEEGRLSVSFRFRVDENVVSWLSSIAKSSNHQEVNRIPKNTEENAERIEKKDSSSSAPISSTVLDSSTQSSQGKKVSFSPSLGTELETGKSSASPTNSSDLTSGLKNSAKIVDSKKSSNVDEPLFWPYDQRFDWTPEDILKHFSMSPQKKKSLNAKVSAGGSPRSMRAQLLQTRKPDLKDCKRKLVFNGPVPNTSKIPELKRTISNGRHKKTNSIKNEPIKNEPIKNCVKRNKSLPSRLRKSSNSKVVPIEVAEEKAKVETTARNLMNRRSKTMVEDDFAFMNDFSIENAVGLGEFKGREGIDSEFNSDTFFFDDSL